MKNLKKEDFYDWVKNYFPSYLKNPNYDLDTLIELYQRGKDILGKFKIGDIVSYDWQWQYSPPDDLTYTSVAIFNCYKRDESGDVCMSSNNHFIFNALISDTNIYDIDDNQLSINNNFVCLDDMRLASEDEKKFFFEKIKKYTNQELDERKLSLKIKNT